MSIKICSYDLDSFTKIKDAIKKFGDDFDKDFQTAEYILGFSTIQLVTNNYYNDKIKLPKGFTIEEIIYDEYTDYEQSLASKDKEIKQISKYKVIIEGEFDNQIFQLIYSNLSKRNITICYK